MSPAMALERYVPSISSTLLHSGVRGRQVALPSAARFASCHQYFLSRLGSLKTLVRVGGTPVASTHCFITSALVAHWMKSRATVLFLAAVGIANSQLPSWEVCFSPFGKGTTAILPDTFDFDASSICAL